MKTIITAIFIYIFALSMLAQEHIQVDKTALFTDVDSKTKLLFAESDGNNGFISVRSYKHFQKKGFYIDHFDANMKRIETHSLFEDNHAIKEVWIKDKQLNMIVKYRDNKKKIFVFQHYTTPTNKIEFTVKDILTVKDSLLNKYLKSVDEAVLANEQYDADTFGLIRFSTNKKNMVISFDLLKDPTTKLEQHKLYVFNQNFELIYEKLFLKETRDHKYKLQDFLVDDKGNILITAKHVKSIHLFDKKTSNYQYEIVRVNKDSEQTISFENADFLENQLKTRFFNNTLICAGLYSDIDSFKSTGFFKYSIDLDSFTLINQTYLPFSKQLLKDMHHKRNKGISNLEIVNVFIDNEGGVYITAEKQHTDHKGIFDIVLIRRKAKKENPFLRYFYYEIVAAKIDSDNSLAWSRLIKKKQTMDEKHDNNDVYSYSSTVVNGQNYFFFNASSNIKTLNKKRYKFRTKGAIMANLYALVIDSKGNIKPNKLIDYHDNEVTLRVRETQFLTTDSNELILLGRRGINKQLVKITID
jgi:hypothetical protein